MLTDVDSFCQHARGRTVLDVRAPSEFEQGHLPGAVSFPLFSDQEREAVGTLYHEAGREEALLKGLEFVGPQLRSFVERARELNGPEEPLFIYCARGGMRSEAMGWLLEMAGFPVHRLEGGYKRYRRYVLESFERQRPVRVLSGPTGSGKTEILIDLAEQGEQVIDLEGLADHRGSVFGGLGRERVMQQQFENELAMRWRALDPERPVWVEDESRRIGSVTIPEALWKQMRSAPVTVLDPPREERIARLVEEYGRYDQDELTHALGLIERRLGGLRTKKALEAIEQDDLAEACDQILSYYDRAYEHGLSKRDEQMLDRRPVPPGTETSDVARLLTEHTGEPVR